MTFTSDEVPSKNGALCSPQLQLYLHPFLCAGIVSLVSLAILSYERYSTILCYTKADPSDYKKAWLAIAGAWLYSLVWTVPPFFGWSSYGPEGPGTTCSVQWHQRSSRNISYVTCLFIFCLLLPLLLMMFCYGKILFAVRGVSQCRWLTLYGLY